MGGGHGSLAGVNQSILGRGKVGETPAPGGGTAKPLLLGCSGSRIPALANLWLLYPGPHPGWLVPEDKTGLGDTQGLAAISADAFCPSMSSLHVED